MSKCLVTKFKDSVNNSNLPIMGAAVFELTNKEGGGYTDFMFRIYAENAKESTVKAEGGTFQIVGSVFKNVSEHPVLSLSEKWSDNAVYPDSADWNKLRYVVSNIYNIKTIEMGSQLRMVNGINSLFDYGVITKFELRGGSIDVGSCKCGKLERLSAIAGAAITGNWYDIIANNPNLTYLVVWDGRNELPANCADSHIEDLAGFGGSLTGLPTTISSLKSDLFSGSLNDYVARIRAAGRTTGSITLVLAQNSQMTLDGATIPTWCANHGITPQAYMYLVWTASSVTLTTTNPNA